MAFPIDDDAEDRAADLFSDGSFFDVDELFRVFNVTGVRAPFVVAVQVKTFLVSALHTVTIGLSWDAARALESPAIDVAAGTTAYFTVDEKLGTQLEVWCAGSAGDSGVDELVDARVLTPAAAAREQGRQREDAKDPLGLPSAGLIVGAVVVVGVAQAFANRRR